MTREVEQAIRQQLATAVGTDRYELWFERFGSPRVVGEALLVTASDSFSLDWLRRTFQSDLRSVAQPHGLELRYDVDAGDVAAAPKKPAVSASRKAKHSISDAAASQESEASPRASAKVARRGSSARSRLQQLVLGNHNRMALASAQHVLEHPGSATPLFVHGPTGCGKTHLLQALHHDALRRRELRRCLFLSAEQFTSAFLEALHGRGLPSFRAKHRDVDLLLIDDVHFLAGKRATLVEFQHTLDELLNAQRQVVLTSNRLPGELTELGSELMGRFSSGLVCGLDYPQEDAKHQLVQSLAEQKGVRLDDAITALLVDEVPGDARLLTGAINRMLALKLAGVDEPTLAEVREHLHDLLQPSHLSVGISEVEEAVCDAFGIKEDLLRSPNKSRQVSQPRMLAMWLARKHTRAALSEIGEHFGGRSHSTVIAAQRTVESWVEADKELGASHRPIRVQDAIRRIERRLNCG